MSLRLNEDGLLMTCYKQGIELKTEKKSKKYKKIRKLILRHNQITIQTRQIDELKEIEKKYKKLNKEFYELIKKMATKEGQMMQINNYERVFLKRGEY